MGTDFIETAHHPVARPGELDVGQRTKLMYAQIVGGLTEQRIAPGTRLREEKLAGLYEVSRTQVRKVLQRLELEGLVQRSPNRGVIVASPDRAETHEIFDARRLIEPWVVSRLCDHCTKRSLLGLRRIVLDEQTAHDAGDRRGAVRLSGEFHRSLAAEVGNRAIAKSMDELTLRTCLAILGNQAPTGVACRNDEHERIIEAVERGDSKLAARLMVAHLDHIEASLDAPPAPVPADGLEAFYEELATPAPRKSSIKKKSS